ncbi:MAG: hypothetical protein KC912_19870 [Proteobacteria bacterium]|nr:hypothetical protein [Pseudomonadota bacterium]
MLRPQLGTLVLFGMCSGCAPFYVPKAGTLSLLEDQGDGSISAQIGTHGSSADVSYAATDSVAVRGGLQFAPTPTYASAWGGVGTYAAFGPGRAAGFIEVGGGAADSQSEASVNGTVSQYRSQGTFVNSALAFEIGFETDFFALGLTTRGLYHLAFHGSQSDRAGTTGQIFTVEPMIGARVGVQTIKFEAQTGIAFPIWVDGDVGAYFPWRIGMGLVFEWPHKNRGADWAEKEPVHEIQPDQPAPAPEEDAVVPITAPELVPAEPEPGPPPVTKPPAEAPEEGASDDEAPAPE